MYLEIETWKREESTQENPFPEYQKRTLTVSNGREAMTIARDIYREARSNGLGCFLIRRDDSGFGELLNLQF